MLELDPDWKSGHVLLCYPFCLFFGDAAEVPRAYDPPTVRSKRAGIAGVLPTTGMFSDLPQVV